MKKLAVLICMFTVSISAAIARSDDRAERSLASRLADEVIGGTSDQQSPATADPSATPKPNGDAGATAANLNGLGASAPTVPNAASIFNGAPCPNCGVNSQIASYGCATGDCCTCGPSGTFWVREEYVGWWANGDHLPALVATNPNGTLPTNTTLFGNDVVNGDYRPGVWTDLGMWLDCCHTWGVDFDYFYVGRESSPFFASSDGDPILTRPFIDANTGNPSEQLVAFPGSVVGSVSVNDFNTLSSAGFDFRRNLCCCCCNCCDPLCYQCCGGLFRSVEGSRLDLLFGFRYYGFYDDLVANEHLTSISQTSGIPVGTQFNITDSFRTQNNFYGAELGLEHRIYRGSWVFDGTYKVALGSTQQLVSINGSTIVSFPGQPTAVNEGGLLALSSNIGHYSQAKFAAIPQLSWHAGYRLTERLTFMAGYTFIYFGNVVRAADQIDTTVNPNLIPPATPGGPNRPAFSFNTSNVWLQGITLGLEYNF